MDPIPFSRVLGVAALAFAASPLSANAQRSIPVEFWGDRLFARPVTAAGDTLRFHLHTGGPEFIYADQAVRLGIPVEAVTLGAAGADTMFVAAWPAIRESAIPEPAGEWGAALPVLFHTRRAGVTADWTGQLGAGWFGDRVWTLDYGAETLLTDTPPGEGTHRIPLTLTGAPGGGAVPRLSVVVAGDTLDLVLGTGSMVFLTDGAAAAMDDGPIDRGMSFVEPELLRRWRLLHPGWRFVSDVDRAIPGTAMIEIPVVEIAGLEIGPVWFAARVGEGSEAVQTAHRPRAFDGVLGGSALRYLRVTLDYPAGVAVFERSTSRSR